MSGLANGQFFDYLIIAIVAGAVAGIVSQVAKLRFTKASGQILFAVVFLVVGVLGRFMIIHDKPQVVIPGTVLNQQDSPSPSSTTTPTRDLHASYMSRKNEEDPVRQYIAPPSKSSRKTGQWSVLIADPEGHESYSTLAETVATVLSERGQSTAAIFRPPATHGAAFESLFAADPAQTRQLNQYCDHIFLGKVTSSQKDNPAAPGLLSLSLTLNGKIIATRSGDVQQELELSAVGAGYSTEEAKSNAEEILAGNLRSELLKAIK